MAILKRLEEFLDRNHVTYKAVIHPEAYTAQEIAASMHVKGRELVKSVMVKADGKIVMAVLPASHRVDFERLKKALGEKDIRLATEGEFARLFPDCEPGAEPPFGNLYNVETIVDKSLAGEKDIYFNAGTHYEAVEMEYSKYEELVRPKVAEFAVH